MSRLSRLLPGTRVASHREKTNLSFKYEYFSKVNQLVFYFRGTSLLVCVHLRLPDGVPVRVGRVLGLP